MASYTRFNRRNPMYSAMKKSMKSMTVADKPKAKKQHIMPAAISRHSIYNQPFRVKVDVEGFLTLNTGSNTFSGIYYQLNQVPNYNTKYTNLFDQYKINGIRVTIYPASNYVSQASATTVDVPQVTYAVDTTDATIPTSMQYLYAYSNAVTKPLDKYPVSFFFRPKTASFSVVLDNNIATLGQAVGQTRWLSSANANASHYGLKLGITCNNLTQMPTCTIKIITRYYLEFRDPR